MRQLKLLAPEMPAAVSPSLPTKFANWQNTHAARQKILPRLLKRFRPRQTKLSSSWKKERRKWKSELVWPTRPEKRSKQFRASCASRPNLFRKSHSLLNSRCAEQKALQTRCRLFPGSPAKLRKVRVRPPAPSAIL